MKGPGSRVLGLGFWVHKVESRVQGPGSRVGSAGPRRVYNLVCTHFKINGLRGLG